MDRLKPSNNAAIKDLGSEGATDRKGTFPFKLTTNTQFDDPSGSEVRGEKLKNLTEGLGYGFAAASRQANTPSDASDNLGKLDLRNTNRGGQVLGTSGTIKSK